jgi:hypothetical protein
MIIRTASGEAFGVNRGQKHKKRKAETTFHPQKPLKNKENPHPCGCGFWWGMVDSNSKKSV